MSAALDIGRVAGAGPRPGLTLRRLLVRLVLTVQIPLALAIAGLLATYWDNQRDHTMEAMRATTASLDASLSDQFKQVQRHLERLSARIPASGEGLADFHREATDTARAAGAGMIVLVRPSGEQVVNTLRPLGARLPGTTPEALMVAARTGQPAVLELSRGPAEGEYASGVGIPVLTNSTVAYALNAGLGARWFERLFAGPALRAGWTAGFADRHGTVVAHSADRALVGSPMPAALMQQAQAGSHGTSEWTGPDGEAMLGHYTRSPVHGWTAFVTVPRAVLLEPVWSAAGKLLLALCAMVVLGLWGAVRLSGRIAHSLDALQQAAHAFPAGRQVVLPRLTFTEAEDLGAALAASGRAVQQANAAAEHGEQQLAAVLRTAANPIIVTDSAHRIVIFNDAAEIIFGRSKAAMAGHPLDLLFTPRSWRHFRSRCATAAVADSALARPAQSAHSVCLRASGATFAAELLVSQFVDAAGERFCTVIFRDLTDRLRSQQSLLAAQREVQRINDSFQRTLLKEMDSRMAGIARELHDSVGATLAGISLLAASGRSTATEPRLVLLLGKVQQQVHVASERVRQISRGIMPAGIDAGALLPALEQFALDIGATQDIACSVRSRGCFEGIAPEVGGHVYRIVQEATANALRHGNATHIRIVLAQAGERCRLSVVDNGSGFDLERLRASRAGVGMKSMRARAAAVDGKLHVRARPGAGCRVSLEWHVNQPPT